jgi:hypothetical protein
VKSVNVTDAKEQEKTLAVINHASNHANQKSRLKQNNTVISPTF